MCGMEADRARPPPRIPFAAAGTNRTGPHGAPSRIGIVAAMREREIEPNFDRQLHDLRLAELGQRRVNLQMRAAFHAGLGRQVRHVLESGDELRAAIRIARIVDRIHADENVASIPALPPTPCAIRQKNRVARGNISDRNALRHLTTTAASERRYPRSARCRRTRADRSSATRCSRTPKNSATRAAASSSTRCRWP